ncbi:MAG TPA: hypothetical protein VNO22_11100 [Planctomycetota bacterium]|nr:hypothetical protein [Planctomycetota bacterium]
MREGGPVPAALAAGGWVGLVLFLGWQELFVEIDRRWPTVWWFRVPATLLLGLAVLVFALEFMMQEMTVRRWATSAAVFAVFGVLFAAAGIFNPETLHLPRWVLLPVGAYYLLAAATAAAAVRDAA